MISYWVTEDGSPGIAAYRANRGRAIADRFQPLVYDRIGHVVRFFGGAQIFSALDWLTDCQREVVAAIWDGHARAAPQAPRLNDPRRVLLRFELLRELHELGVNSYRVFRATDLKRVTRFPVFVRHMRYQARSRLLKTRSEVAAALCARRLRGYRLRDLMIVEFCDTSDGDGVFRKYSAFKVRDRILPCHVLTSHHWCVKSVHNEPTEERVRDGAKYVDENPHCEWLHRVFAIAGTDYGRIDYGVLDGVPQVWEINLNPTIGRAAGWQRGSSLAAHVKDLREESREVFHRQFRDAFVALDTENRQQEISVKIDDSLISRIAAEHAAQGRRTRFLGALSRLRDHPQIGLPARTVLKMLPRR